MTGVILAGLIASAISAATGIALLLEAAKENDRRHAERRAAELDDTTIDMLDRWKDEPSIIPDSLDRDLAQWMAEWEKRHG